MSTSGVNKPLGGSSSHLYPHTCILHLNPMVYTPTKTSRVDSMKPTSMPISFSLMTPAILTLSRADVLPSGIGLSSPSASTPTHTPTVVKISFMALLDCLARALEAAFSGYPFLSYCCWYGADCTWRMEFAAGSTAPSGQSAALCKASVSSSALTVSVRGSNADRP